MSNKAKTVLIVDDDEGMRDTLTAILKRECRVPRVSSGEAALPILNREDVDLMLLDVRLPGISGFEVLRIVKENYGLIEVLMISAINEIETAVQAMKHGAYHYVGKDFDYDQLRSLVRIASSSASSSWRRTGRCSSTRLATCVSTCRPSCYGRSRKARSNGSAAPSRSRRNSASSPPPTSISRRR